MTPDPWSGCDACIHLREEGEYMVGGVMDEGGPEPHYSCAIGRNMEWARWNRSVCPAQQLELE